jgi:hypothetical protein
VEARPHPLVEAFVGRLLPPACREHVLGDLHERYISDGQYVQDAVRTIPFAIWGQIRRTSSTPLVTAELGVVYVAFLSALGMFEPSALSDSSAPLRAAIPALAALAAVVLRDAWIGRTPRPNAHVAADAVLGIGCAAMLQALLVGVGSPLALPSYVLLAGSATSLALLSGVRMALLPINQRAATAKTGGNQMNPAPSNIRSRMQHDLRLWWWTIAILGLSGWLGLFLYPAVARYRPLLLAWLVAFAAIGMYQRRKTRWPQLPPKGLTTLEERRLYRAELERRRDEQYKWPARQPLLMVGVVGCVFLLGAARLLVPSAGPVPLASVLPGPTMVAVLALGVYLLTRTFTNRAAAAFQREIDALDSELPASGISEDGRPQTST